MNLRIHGLTFGLTDGLSAHVRHQVEFALGPQAGQIERVTVRLDDVNGRQHGGIDKRCHLLIELWRLSPVVIEAVGADMYAAIDQALGRAKVAVRRHLQRRHTLRRDFPRRRRPQRLVA